MATKSRSKEHEFQKNSNHGDWHRKCKMWAQKKKKRDPSENEKQGNINSAYNLEKEQQLENLLILTKETHVVLATHGTLAWYGCDVYITKSVVSFHSCN